MSSMFILEASPWEVAASCSQLHTPFLSQGATQEPWPRHHPTRRRGPHLGWNPWSGCQVIVQLTFPNILET